MKSNWMLFGFYFGIGTAILLLIKSFNIDDQIFNFYRKLPTSVKTSFKLVLPILCLPLLFAYLLYAFGLFIEKLSTSFNPTNLEIVLRGIAPLVTAGIAAYIAYQQYKVNRTNLKLSLHNKRFVLYQSIIELLTKIDRTHKVDAVQIEEYRKMRREASFIFNDQTINEWMEQIYKKLLTCNKLEEAKLLNMGFPTSLTIKKEDGSEESITDDVIAVESRGTSALLGQLKIIESIEGEDKIEKIFRPYLEI